MSSSSLASAEAGDGVERALLPTAPFPLEVGHSRRLVDLFPLHLAGHLFGHQVVPQQVLQAATRQSAATHAASAQAHSTAPQAAIVGHLCAGGGEEEENAGCDEHDVLHGLRLAAGDVKTRAFSRKVVDYAGNVRRVSGVRSREIGGRRCVRGWSVSPEDADRWDVGGAADGVCVCVRVQKSGFA